MRAAEPVRVLYVMGYARSGSTVLNTLLGNEPGVLGAGELSELAGNAWLAGLYCACGQRGHRCPFWARVRSRWAELTGGEDLSGYLRLQRRFEPLPRLPWTAGAARRGSRAWLDYARRTALLFAAVREVAGASLIVDSSKLPARAWALAHAPGIDLRLVHLVRDARAVAWSFRRSFERDERGGVQAPIPARPAGATARRWLAANLAGSWVARRLGPRSLRLRYEDLARDPGAALAALGEALEADFSRAAVAAGSGEDLPVGHCIAGNRLRMQGAIRLRLDEEWKRALPRRDRSLVWALAGWLLRRYGYSR